MKSNATASLPVSTAGLQTVTPSWLTLYTPDEVPGPWRQLIESYLQVAVATLGADPPDRLVLNVVRVGNYLSFMHEFPKDSEELYSVADATLDRVGDHLSQLSGLLLAECLKDERAHQSGRTTSDARGHSAGQSAQEGSAEPDESEERGRGSEVGETQSTRAQGRKFIPVFTLSEKLFANGGRGTGKDAESEKRIASILKRLQWTGPERPVQPPIQGWESMLEDLARTFPNFAGLVKTIIRPHLSLLSKGYLHRMNSLLLVGPPGIGKTYFAQELAQVMDVGRPMFISMNTETNNSTLAGSSTFWSNSSPGRLFEKLAWGEAGKGAIANPLIILDEVDKTSAREYDPLGPLYSLLEAETARYFEDGSLPDVSIDASHVRFIATANDASAIPSPLLSRALVLPIEPPSEAQVCGVIQRMYERIVKRLEVPMRLQLSTAVMERAQHMSPREAKVRLECAIALAMDVGRDTLLPEDWIDADISIVRNQKIGFIA